MLILSFVYTCNKFDPKYIGKSYQHILIRDLAIISNAKFKKFVSKAPKFREPNNIPGKKPKYKL